MFALSANLRLARARAGTAKIWAVVKADAYGHGLERVQPALEEADGLALLELDQAARARERGWEKPILMLEGFFDETELETFTAYHLTTVVHCVEQVAILEKARLFSPLDVYIKLNSGMNRLGIRPADTGAVLRRLRESGNVGNVTLMSHFADADGPGGVAEQMAVIEQVSQWFKLPVSCANSAAILRFPQTRTAWVRPGIMLYGCSPFPDENAMSIGVTPVMTLSSQIIAVQEVEKGARVGYSGTFVAPRAMRVGVVACGYADGYPRHAPGGTPILVNGTRTGTLGRVSMDMLFADLSGLPDAGVGSSVTLWGHGLSADEVASSAGTVSYELLCGLTQRVPVKVID